MTTAHEADISGEELNRQRFQMLEDIAKELSGEIVFPTCFDVAVRLRQALRDTDQPVGQIVEQISFEPLIGAKLLSMANSVAFNPTGVEVKDVKSAVVRLGLRTIRSVAMAIAMKQMLQSRTMEGLESMSRPLWEHSLRTASACYVVAKRLTHFNPDVAMTAGLVHDLGAFYMLYHASQYPALRERPQTMRYLVAQWHESIGTSVLNALGMPEEIVEAIRDHDVLRAPPAKPRSLNDVVYVGNLLVGTRQEWMFLDVDETQFTEYALGESYTSLQEEISLHAAEVGAVFA